MTNQLAIGDTAPDFTLEDSEGNTVSLSDYRGSNVVVYFYPKAATPGCTTEACDFRDSLASLEGAGYKVIGLSPDPVEALADFTADQKLTFPLLADPDAAVAKNWGAWGYKTRNGETREGILRSTFVIDGDGMVDLAEYDVDPNGHVARLREELGVDQPAQ
ncbi:peroxiredoxin Q/BCP [Paramicrobacterium humi]|uniref:thioredoxin-dependent peroxiredoxin n=1 Tax=Paramicrobacterium humi TaxID=640635 RepID=A0A1H4NIN0_9MICO|nr:thioredoxin-dependent thiol peroxidase [Microbacterium humi]SEB94735.1 peroxiredoxin Q/BCP [Microbacterium humi]